MGSPDAAGSSRASHAAYKCPVCLVRGPDTKKCGYGDKCPHAQTAAEVQGFAQYVCVVDDCEIVTEVPVSELPAESPECPVHEHTMLLGGWRMQTPEQPAARTLTDDERPTDALLDAITEALLATENEDADGCKLEAALAAVEEIRSRHA